MGLLAQGVSMRLRIQFVTAIFLLASSSVLAANPKSKVDFDQGPNASSILAEAREISGVSGLPSLIPFLQRDHLPELDKIAVPFSLLERLAVSLPEPATKACDDWNPDQDGRGSGKACSRSDEPVSCPPGMTAHALLPKSIQDLKIPKGAIFGPFRPLPEQSAVYQVGLGWRQKIDPLPAPVRDPLVSDWNGIESNRSGLINAGGSLDIEDEALYADAVRLNIWSDRIDARLQIGNQWLARYNQECLGRPLPPDEYNACTSWANRFNGCAARHNASVQRYNAAVAAWQSAYTSLESRGGAFITRVGDWENLRIKPFIERATKALAGACRMATSLAIAAPPSKVGVTSPGGETVHFVAKATFATKPEGAPACELAWTLDNGALGSLSPKTGPATVFNPNRLRGSGVVKVTEKVSGLSDFGSITVQGGRECIPVSQIPTPPAGPNDTFKMTCTYECPLSGPHVLFLSDSRDYPTCPVVYEP